MKRAALLITGLLAGVLLLAVACGGEEDTLAPTRPQATTPPAQTSTPAPTRPQATTPPAATQSPAPASTAAPTVAPETILGISVDGDALGFRYLDFSVLLGDICDLAEGTRFCVRGGTQVTLTFRNVSTVNQHNWVLVNPGTKDDVAARGTAAGPNNDWLQPGDPDVIASTKLLNAGETAEITFAAPPPGIYQFVCTFPGHNSTMFSDFEVVG